MCHDKVVKRGGKKGKEGGRREEEVRASHDRVCKHLSGEGEKNLFAQSCKRIVNLHQLHVLQRC